MTTVADLAVRGLKITSRKGLVLVEDGEDRWLCSAVQWDAALARLEDEEAVDTDDEASVDAYTRLCCDVRGAVASVTGTSRGEGWEALVGEAFAVGLIDGMSCYGVEAMADDAANTMSYAERRAWAAKASVGDYLATYEGDGSRCGYSDAVLAEVRDRLSRRGLTLRADDRGLVVARR